MSGAKSGSAPDVMLWDGGGGGGPLGTAASNQCGEVSNEANLTAALSLVSSLTFAFESVAEVLRFRHQVAHLPSVGSIN